MASVTLTAVQVPLPPVPTADTFAETQRKVLGEPLTSGVYRQGTIGSNLVSTLNRDLDAVDHIAQRGAGAFAINFGLDPTIGTLLNVDVTAGSAGLDGLVEKTTTTSVPIDPSIARAHIYLKVDGTFEVENNTLVHPAGDVCYIGSCVTNGTNVTSVDTSGVMFYNQGSPFRETADTGVPGDSPTSAMRFWHHTSSETFWWNGSSYVLMSGAKAREGLHADRAGFVDGDSWQSTDGLLFERFDGSTWTQYGPLHPVTKVPVVAGWTNKGAAMDIAIDSAGTLYFEKDEAAVDDAALRVVTEAAPYTVEMGFIPNSARSNDWTIGLAFYEDATGKFQQIELTQLAVVITNWTDFQNKLATPRFRNWHAGSPMFFKVQDDNVDLTFYVSRDGINWIFVYTIARGSHFTTAPDRVGVMLNANTASEPSSLGVTVFHWKVT